MTGPSCTTRWGRRRPLRHLCIIFESTDVKDVAVVVHTNRTNFTEVEVVAGDLERVDFGAEGHRALPRPLVTRPRGHPWVWIRKASMHVRTNMS
ncbi:hypothetical protein PF003_g4563 [Phytophthora fragariae]|nr:hypothetical protein PF003_g4563 [Phytophthora fragariae]